MYVSRVVHGEKEWKPDCVLTHLTIGKLNLPVGRVIKLKCGRHPEGHQVDKWGAVPDCRVPYMQFP